MRNFHTSRGASVAGFTLIELMITLVIATILLTIAIPSYQSQIRKSRRTDAKTALLDLAAREERYMSTNNAYTPLAVNVGYAQGVTFPQNLLSGYYRIELPVVVAAVPGTTVAAGVPAAFTLTATAIGTQAKDTQCASFTLTSANAQTATGTDAANCWK